MSGTPASLLARRLARVLGASALALPAAAACGGNVVVDGGTSGTGGASSSTTSSSSSGAGGATVACAPALGCPDGPGGPGPEWMACFMPTAGSACPDAADALPFFGHGCVLVSSVFAACAGGPAGVCCYNVAATCACIGRPFVVDGAARVAVTRDGDEGGWCERPPAMGGADLPRAVREALASAYLEDALGEHASVVSFGRFALELLALGAPAELVDAAHRAALDEVRHARITFGLASAFGGSPVGPTAFPIGPAVHLRTDIAAFARAAVVEGCIRETMAALLAAERAAAAADPRVKAGLLSIAEDEARHAELAWKTVAWVLDAGGDEVADAVFATLADAARHAPAVPGAGSYFPVMRVFGVLDARATRGVLAAGLTEIVAPSARTLRERRPRRRPS